MPTGGAKTGHLWAQGLGTLIVVLVSKRVWLFSAYFLNRLSGTDPVPLSAKHEELGKTTKLLCVEVYSPQRDGVPLVR